MGEIYVKRVFRRGVHDAISALGWNWKTVVIGLCWPFGAVAYWAIAGTEAVVSEIIAASLFGLLPAIVAGFVMLAYHIAVAPSRMQREADQRAKGFQDELHDIREKQSQVDALSDMLDEGIHRIWNFPVNNQTELDDLSSYWATWDQGVAEYLSSHFTRSDVIHFSRLGVVPIITRGATFNPQHQKILREYALKESRLREIIRDYNARNYGTRQVSQP